MLLPYSEHKPNIRPSVFIAPGAIVVGRVYLEEDVSIWYNAVVRGDVDEIRIGSRSNIQDGCILHQNKGLPLIIGEDVTVGHGALLHGCTIGDRCLIGMGAIILSGAKVGSECLIGAGTLIREGQEIPPGSMVVGSPARIIRELSKEEREDINQMAKHYVMLADQHKLLAGN